MILDIMKQLASDSGKQVAFTFLDDDKKRELTFGQIYEKASKVATELINKGIKKGERILILADQSAENVISVVGSMLAKGVFVIIPPPVDEGKRKRLASVIESCQPKFCLVSHVVKEKITEEKLEGMLGEQITLIDVSEAEIHEVAELDIKREEMDLVYIQYTSGSTSDPKGIMVDYKNLMSALADSAACIPREKAKTGLSWVPFYHNIGLLTTIFRTFYAKTHFYIMKPEVFLKNPLSWFVNCAKYNIEYTAGPNSAFALCANYLTEEQAKQLDLSKLRYILNGSEPVSYKTLEEFVDKFRPTGIYMDCFCPAYGLAEVVCGVTTAVDGVKTVDIDFEAYKNNRFIPSSTGTSTKTVISQGTVYSNTQVAIVNPKTLKPCEPDEIGEIWITGTSVTRGYWGVSPAEDTTFHQHLPGDEKEYMRTGDYGILYDGELYVTGRMKEVLIINGHNIYPNDIENDLRCQIPELAGAAFAIFQTAIGNKERMIICLEAKLPDELCAKSSKQIQSITQTNYDVSPYDIVFCEPFTFPRTDNGKVKKAAVAEYYKKTMLKVLYSEQGRVEVLETTLELDEVEQKVKKVIEDLLKTTVRSREDDFLDLGGNSFDSAELAQVLSQEFSISLDVGEILKNTQFKELVLLVKQKQQNNEVFIRQENLYEDCVLPEDIQLKGDYVKELSQCRHIFVTGTTGFLGAYLLKAYLENGDVTLYCHVRAESEAAGFNRIKENMERYGLWKNSYEEHIVAIPGDLRKPKLGMSREWYDRVSRETDLIVHNGAMLNFLYTYSYLSETNVFSTVECIRLACSHHPKYISYVSTFSVFDNPSHFGKHVMEDDPLEKCEGYLLPYSETKWVSEKILGIARERGLRTLVFRPGEITGSSITGKWNYGDMVSRCIVASLLIGEVPTPYSNLYMTPVDYVADAIAYISRQPKSWNHAYNLVNLNILSGDVLCKTGSRMGYSLQAVPYKVWREHLFQGDIRQSPLKILEKLFSEDDNSEASIAKRYSVAEATFDISNTLRVLEGSGISCPPVTEELVLMYLENFREQGLLKNNE